LPWFDPGTVSVGGRRQKHVDGHAQGERQSFDVIDGDVTDSPFDMPDEGAVQAGLESELFL